MPVVGRRDADRVEVGAREQLAEVLVPLATLVLIVSVDLVHGFREMPRVHVRDGQHAAVRDIEKRIEVAVALPADADAADLHLRVLRRAQPEGAAARGG